MPVGIMAFGSLLDRPGRELQGYIARRIDGIKTPFPVEFARSSRTRDSAPTLVRVTSGGAVVEASVLVLKDTVDEELARDLLYRRETWQVGEAVYYRDAREKFIRNMPFPGVATCVYAALRANIEPLTAAELAERAISSARSPAGVDRRDGISYLDQQKRRGVVTPLMPGYEEKVLARTGGRDLEDAWLRARGCSG